jgi:acetoin utilization protein AcuB
VAQEEYNRVLETTPVTRAMTKEPVTVLPDQAVFEAAQVLYSRHFGCLPVVEKGELVGIVTTSDMLRLLVQIIHSRGAAARE